MPDVLRQIDEARDNPIIKFVVDLGIKQALKKVMEALGSIGSLASHLISYSIPSTVDYCFEVKDSLKDHALYRFNGVEHKDSFGVMDVISFITKVLYPQNPVLCGLGNTKFDNSLGWNLDLLLRLWF
jgi:hypothetical protein